MSFSLVKMTPFIDAPILIPKGRSLHIIFSQPGRQPAAISKGVRREAIREIVFGVNDGLISITGLVVGVASSQMGAHQVLLAGLAATTAAVVAMGMGAYLSTAAQNQYLLAERDREYQAIQTHPQIKQQQVSSYYQAQGMADDLISRMTRHIVSDRRRWVTFLVKEKLGVSLDHLESPWISALLMAVAVLAGSLAPMLPFVLSARVSSALPWSIGLALFTAYTLGAVKAQVTNDSPWRSGLQFVVAASIAVSVGMAAGRMFHSL